MFTKKLIWIIFIWIIFKLNRQKCSWSRAKDEAKWSLERAGAMASSSGSAIPHPLPFNQSHRPTRKPSQPSPCSRRLSNNQTLCLNRQSTHYWAAQEAFRLDATHVQRRRKMSQSNNFLDVLLQMCFTCYHLSRSKELDKWGEPQNIHTIKGFIEEYEWWKEVGGSWRGSCSGSEMTARAPQDSHYKQLQIVEPWMPRIFDTLLKIGI